MLTPLFGVLLGPDFSYAYSLLSSNRSYIDGVELRLDTFYSIDLEKVRAFLQDAGLPVMMTLRRKDQGGQFQGSEKERLDVLSRLCALKPAYLDLEYDVPESFRHELFESYPDVCFLNSYHDFHGTPHNLSELHQKIHTPYTHITKIAVTAHNTTDALHMIEFIRAHSKEEKIIGISMGEAGKLTRILSPLIGNSLTYATLNESKSIAPGQLTAHQMQETYHFRAINPRTKVYALIGDPVDKSLGDVIHNAWFFHQHENAVYVKISLKTEEIPSFFQKLHVLSLRGLSVTMPHKESVMSFLTHPSKDVMAIGACNTIRIENQQILGFNTDGIGAVNAIEKVNLVKGRHLIILGAGGAAKAIAYEALQRGAHVTLLNRTAEKAKALAAFCHCQGGGFDLMPQVLSQGYSFLVNCIPDNNLFEDAWILPDTIVMDIVYVPKMTAFLQKAAKKNCHIIFGQEMFINQAIAQQEIWFPQVTDKKQCYNVVSLCFNNL